MRTSPKIKETTSSTPAKPAGSKAGSNFMEVVYSIVRRIPKGRATSYGAIAEASGIRLTARMVGWAMNAAGRAKPPVPAHRVVNSKGELSGRAFFATPTLMQELLEQEGVRVKNDRIEDFEQVFWDPAGKHGKPAVKPAASKVGPARAKASKLNAGKKPAAKPATTNARPAKAKASNPDTGKKPPSRSVAPEAKPAKASVQQLTGKKTAQPGPVKQKAAPSPQTKKPR